MTIYLVRHGLAAAGVADLDPGLAPLGHQQAAAAAAYLATVISSPSSMLVVSPLRRTRETADPIAAMLELEPVIRDEVAEVFDPAMPPGERQSMIGPFMAGRWSEQSPALRAWRRKVIATIVELGLKAEAASGHLVIVSHYIAIGAAIGEASGDDRVVPLPIANASITAMRAGRGSLSLDEAASTAHLAPEQVTGTGQAMPGGPSSP
jgi:broad specificity phosphatase PhoE